MRKVMNSATAACGLILVATLGHAQPGTDTRAAPPGDSQSHAHDHGGYGQKLGSVQFPVSCRDATRTFVDEGLALLHHMTYEDSARAFAAASEAEPECAMDGITINDERKKQVDFSDPYMPFSLGSLSESF